MGHTHSHTRRNLSPPCRRALRDRGVPETPDVQPECLVVPGIAKICPTVRRTAISGRVRGGSDFYLIRLFADLNRLDDILPKVAYPPVLFLAIRQLVPLDIGTGGSGLGCGEATGRLFNR